MDKIYLVVIWTSTIIGGYFVASPKDGINKSVPRSIEYTRSDTTKNCLECHAEVMKHEVKHMAARLDCRNCHDGISLSHPGDSVKGLALKSEVPNLCFQCHGHIIKGKNVHPPVQQGLCLDCHNPHSSPNKRLWRAATSGELCLKCHAEKLALADKNMLHAPVEQGLCHDCHNPHSTDNEKFLKNEVPRLCLSCHKDKRESMKMDHVHVPFQQDCRICHHPHGSMEGNLRHQKIIPLCTMCHPKIGAQIRKSPVLHKAVEIDKNCANCHSPHASDHDKQLLGEIQNVCLKCHQDEIQGETRLIPSIGNLIAGGNHVHGAIAEEKSCVGCHNPHAGERERMLEKNFLTDLYVKGTDSTNFELCFSCHNSDLLKQQTTLTATNFRKVDKNLHFVHVNQEKGRNCKICHNIHGSINEKLINEKVNFGNWEMPLRFVKEENGGSCAPGCHEPRSYNRLRMMDQLSDEKKK